jgi:tetratricopeptide (TPR) repeat protein
VSADIAEAYVEGHALHNLGRAYLEMGRTDEAASALHAAIAVHRSTGDQVGEAAALEHLGRAQQGLGQLAEARGSWLAALGLRAGLGDKDRVAEIESLLASLSLSGSNCTNAHSADISLDYARRITRLPAQEGIR